MVFIIMKIVLNLTILKDWFGCKYNNTNNLLELYNDFSSGTIDKGAPMAQSARICASAGRSKTPEDKCPVSVCDMCLSGKKTFVKKRGRMAGKERARSVILLPAHPASFAHNFVSGMQSFYFSESKDAIVLQTCHLK